MVKSHEGASPCPWCFCWHSNHAGLAEPGLIWWELMVSMRCYFTAIFTLSLPIQTTTMVPFVVETGDVDETTGRLDGDAALFCWFNTIGDFDSLNSSKVAPRFCCFISLDCRCRDMKCSIFDIWMIESIIKGWWNFLCVTIDVFYISTNQVLYTC